jgi:hypothetical protein
MTQTGKMLRLIGVGAVLIALAGCGSRKPAEDDVLNVQARLPQGMPVPAMDWRVISMSVDRTHQAAGTMATLTGNDLAVKYAGSGVYPVGSELALATWLERDDPHWFGARIPGSFVALETVTMERGGDGKATAIYKRYAGDPLGQLREVLVTDAGGAEARKAAILGMRASVMP